MTVEQKYYSITDLEEALEAWEAKDIFWLSTDALLEQLKECRSERQGQSDAKMDLE